MMPGVLGLEVLDQLRSRGHEAEVVMLIGQGTIETAVEAMKLGATEFLTKLPWGHASKDLDRLVQKSLGSAQLSRENCQLKAALKQQQTPTNIIR